jgi:PAS domain S-box-containing protein
MESELRKTKEFLERLIDATADGIVAADLKGRILLFNKGAERVTGYSAAEVVGRMHVAQLYPEGQAREIMRGLRGGDGKFRMGRARLVGKLGEEIPIALSTALITEGGHETASVGVFSDLRERLRVEAELLETQQKLAIVEKQALVSELAGTAAHELNQPLTSILGFAELLHRRGSADDSTAEALGAILREAERMAGIVRKIGRITRYETKEYVGNRRIVDLDRAATPVEGLPQQGARAAGAKE